MAWFSHFQFQWIQGVHEPKLSSVHDRDTSLASVVLDGLLVSYYWWSFSQEVDDPLQEVFFQLVGMPSSPTSARIWKSNNELEEQLNVAFTAIRDLKTPTEANATAMCCSRYCHSGTGPSISLVAWPSLLWCCSGSESEFKGPITNHNRIDENQIFPKLPVSWRA